MSCSAQSVHGVLGSVTAWLCVGVATVVSMLSASTLPANGLVSVLRKEMRYQPGCSTVSCQVTVTEAPGRNTETRLERGALPQGKVVWSSSTPGRAVGESREM